MARKKTRSSPKPPRTYAPGIGNPRLAQALGAVVAGFSQLELMMVYVMHSLLGSPPNHAGRAVFLNILNARTRIDVMKGLLDERADRDEINEWSPHFVREFDRMNTQRNRYVHGVWWHAAEHPETENYLASAGDGLDRARVVTAAELETFLGEMNSLWFTVKQAGKFELSGIPLPKFRPPRDAPKA